MPDLGTRSKIGVPLVRGVVDGQTPTMSQTPPPPPYGAQPPYGGPSPQYAAPPRRKRPRKIWFFIGGALIVLAPIIFVGALFTVLRPLTQEDAVFTAGDSPVQVDLPAGEERAVFSTDGAAIACTATDGSGEDLPLRGVTGEFTLNEWTAVARFDTGDGAVTFECDDLDTGVEIRIAQLPSTGVFVAGIVIGVVAPLVLGLVGFLMLIITAILYASGAPRTQPGTD